MNDSSRSPAGEMPADMLAVGVVRGTHGLDGRVKVESLSGEADHFYGMTDITVVQRGQKSSRRINSIAGSGSSLIMKLEGTDGIDEARRLVGAELWQPRDRASPLGEAEYYYRDLCRCDLVLEGRTVGRITGISSAAGIELLEVLCTEKKTVLVPFRDEFIGEVSVESRTVELKAGWILE